MRVQVLYFHQVRKITGSAGESVEMEEGATLGDLVAILVKKHPGLEALVGSLLFAVNETHARIGDRLAEGDVAALMPPFSGG